MKDTLIIFRPYLRGLPIILFMMIGGYMLASKYLNYVTPMYESTTKVKLADISEGITNSNLFKDFDVFATSNKVAGEIEVLKSEVLLNKALDQLDFDLEIYRKGKIRSVELYHESPVKIHFGELTENIENKEIDFQIDANNLIKLVNQNGVYASGQLGDTITAPFGKVLFTKNEKAFSGNTHLKVADNYSFKFLKRSSLISTVKKNLDITAVDKDVAVIRIIFKSPNPEKAAKLAATLAEVYIHDYIDSKYKVANITANFLEKQIDAVNTKLIESENNIQNFRDRNGITNIRQETETELRRISQLKIQQTNLKMSLQAIEELEAYVKAGKDNFLELAPNFEAFTDLLSTEIVKNIKALQAEKKDLLLVYTEEEESVQIIDKKIEDLKLYLIESISNTRKNLQTKYELLSGQITESEKVFIKVPAHEKMLTILNREFNIYEKSFNFLNEKKIEAEIAQAAKIAFHRVISPAAVPQVPVSPNRTIIKIVAAMLGMFGAIAFIFVIHALKARVNNRKTIEDNSLIPLAVETPKLKMGEDEITHFQRLVTQLEIKGLIQPNAIISISDFKKNEGALYNGLHLAKTLSKQGAKVMVLDVADQAASFPDKFQSIIEDGKGVDIMNLKDSGFELMSKDNARQYILNMAEQYDYTLILNDYLGSRNSLLILAFSNVNFISLDARLTLASKITEANLLIEEYEVNDTHFILNRAHYNPNIVVEVYSYLKKLIRKFTKK